MWEANVTSVTRLAGEFFPEETSPSFTTSACVWEYGVWGLGFEVWSLGWGGWGWGLGVSGFGFRVSGMGFGV